MSHDINRKITQKTQSNDKFNMGTILTPAGFFNTQIKLHLKQLSFQTCRIPKHDPGRRKEC